MIWVLVFINMYWYERNFGSFYRNPTIQRRFRFLSKWVNTDLMDDRRFLLKYNDSENFITDASVFR